jgi:SDR family mycofactocin-dependent oxidoreductase
MRLMADRLAVVTGAARGIGAGTAEALARAGWSVLLVDACAGQAGVDYPMPSAADLDEVATRCLDAGASSAETLVADVGDPGFVQTLRPHLDGRPLRAAVAAAGVIAGAPGWATPEAVWARQLDVNLHGVRRLAEATVPALIDAGEGRFVAVASAAALRAMPELAAYSASKAAVAAYVRSLAADLAGTGVTANAVCPGSTRGPMLDMSAAIYGLGDAERFANQALHRRLLEPSEIAAAVAWLCSPEASALTGAILPVDGGLTA